MGEKAPRLEWSRRVRAMVKKWAGVKWYRARSDHHPSVLSLSDLPLMCLVHQSFQSQTKPNGYQGSPQIRDSVW